MAPNGMKTSISSQSESMSARDLIRENNELHDEIEKCHTVISNLREELFKLQGKDSISTIQNENSIIDSDVNQFKKFY